MELRLKVLNDDEKPKLYTYDVAFYDIDYPNLKGIAEQLQVYLEEKIYPIRIGFTGNNNLYSNFLLYFTRKQAKKLLKDIIPCPKKGMTLKFRCVNWD